jgi:hypothetical protein
MSPTGDDLLPIYDLTATGSSKVRKVSLNQINGLNANDLASVATTALQTAVVVPILTGTAVTNWSITSGGLHSGTVTITLSGTGTATFTGVLTNGVLTSISTTAATGTNSFSGAPTVAVTASAYYTPITSRFTTIASGTKPMTFPPAAGILRSIFVTKLSTTDCVLTQHPADVATSNIISTAGVAGTSSTVTAGSTAQFLSNGTSWYRVS